MEHDSRDGASAQETLLSPESGTLNVSRPRLPTVTESFYAALLEGSERYCEDETTEARLSSGLMWLSISNPNVSISNPNVSLSSHMPKKPGRILELVVILLMTASGSLVSFFGGLLYRLSPAYALNGVNSILADIWMTYVLTLGVFVFCALGAALSRANRVALYERATPLFLGVLLIPSSMDLLVTGLATIALGFTQPALVSILKNAVQLAVLSGASRLVLHKKQSCSQWLCLAVVMAGVVALAVNVVLFGPHSTVPGGDQPVADQVIGASLACLSGALGAWRNLAEAAILQDDTMPSSALLLAESLLSALVLGSIGIVVFIVVESVPSLDKKEDLSLDNMVNTFKQVIAPPAIIGYLICAYGKDAGKFWLIKHTSALRQKILALLFPFGTWAVSLVTFYILGGQHHFPTLGHKWDWPSSGIELGAFLLILISNIIFVQLKEKASCPARWCAKIDASC